MMKHKIQKWLCQEQEKNSQEIGMAVAAVRLINDKLN